MGTVYISSMLWSTCEIRIEGAEKKAIEGKLKVNRPTIRTIQPFSFTELFDVVLGEITIVTLSYNDEDKVYTSQLNLIATNKIVEILVTQNGELIVHPSYYEMCIESNYQYDCGIKIREESNLISYFDLRADSARIIPLAAPAGRIYIEVLQYPFINQNGQEKDETNKTTTLSEAVARTSDKPYNSNNSNNKVIVVDQDGNASLGNITTTNLISSRLNFDTIALYQYFKYNKDSPSKSLFCCNLPEKYAALIYTRLKNNYSKAEPRVQVYALQALAEMYRHGLYVTQSIENYKYYNKEALKVATKEQFSDYLSLEQKAQGETIGNILPPNETAQGETIGNSLPPKETAQGETIGNSLSPEGYEQILRHIRERQKKA
ncbi:hypothetical protein BCR33DRAFT_768236 [Rhizoclosmatium globosum]|uniref:Uncharacterized protein n=1 Tax=Rhizoclosmatium globosum TaxID=329046 RepID=A0A1Y2BZU0_9FUNG|nr:hypothetical protein BCR33DRAFT_768236 [Rhizoclosmatium globosum]|eukprot:ORY40280.1 hypothetical protein BCR33DRAFT_768236 [Rhizoclosmatium globosum]